MKNIAELREEAMFLLWDKGWTEEEIRKVLNLSINEQRVRRQMRGDSKERRLKEVEG